jgi:hypothetical protein
VDAILLGIHHQTALQLSELTGLRHILTYTNFLLVLHECLQGRNYLAKKLEIPSQEVRDDDILSFVKMEIKLKMSCVTILYTHLQLQSDVLYHSNNAMKEVIQTSL